MPPHRLKVSLGVGVVSAVGLAWAQASCGGSSPSDSLNGAGAVATECTTFCGLQASCVPDAADQAVAQASEGQCAQACTADVGGGSSACQSQFTSVAGCFTAGGCAAFQADPNTGACYQAFNSWASACAPDAVATGGDPNAAASVAATSVAAAPADSTLVVLGRWVRRHAWHR